MKLEEILKLDCTDKENRKYVKSKLMELKSFQEYEPEDITFELLEKVYHQMAKKCYIRINVLMINVDSDYYTGFLKDWKSDKQLPLCYGKTMMEIYMKTIIYMYYKVKKDPSLKRGKEHD